MKLYLLGEPPEWPEHAIPIAYPQEAEGDYYLHWQHDTYYLCDYQQRHPPLTLDFSDAKYSQRSGSETLPKALRGMTEAHIVDATAGWGKDAWLLASRGFSLTLYERNPYLHTLLATALHQAQNNTKTAIIANRLQLVHADAACVLQPNSVDAVYLDPMYPERRKNAKVKKHMQALQQLLGSEENDGATLLSRARLAAKQRVIVKRPQHAAPLAEAPPSYSIHAPNTRYDIYQTRLPSANN
ncbi:MAG: class I SAM-dependent methyltransferase [Cardiobacteriaceae bacterium]|nr:class I SAM-dependent methyltransferase [Cardiobacteriaceae bacterium]